MTRNEKQSTKPLAIGMGEAAFLHEGETACTVLGSCVGLALVHPKLGLAAIAHIVLPTAQSRNGPPGKFADTAVPHLIDLFRVKGVCPTQLVAKAVGGAKVLGSGGPLQIGKANQEQVLALLQAAGIPLVAQHLGGTERRRIVLHAYLGRLEVQVAAEERLILL
ncbi:MAG: chemotaxis protein CheD [Planctomycetales bacterium]|nr:chemotaxis protein CheD [Planctomycetales bacterium]